MGHCTLPLGPAAIKLAPHAVFMPFNATGLPFRFVFSNASNTTPPCEVGSPNRAARHGLLLENAPIGTRGRARQSGLDHGSIAHAPKPGGALVERRQRFIQFFKMPSSECKTISVVLPRLNAKAA